MFSPLLYRGCGVLSKGFGGRGLPWELLCADDLVLLANLEEDLRRLKDWDWGLGRSVERAGVVGCGVGLRRVRG